MAYSTLDTNILNNATITANGSSAVLPNLQNPLDPYVELLVHVANTPTGTGETLQFTLAASEDGVNFDTVYAPAAQFTASPGWLRVIFSNSSTNGAAMENYLKVSWVVAGTSPSYTGVTADILFSNPTVG